MKQIDNLFKDALYNHEIPVPEGMWEKVAPQAEKTGRRAIFWFWALGGFIALMLGGLVYLISQSSDSADQDSDGFPLAHAIDVENKTQTVDLFESLDDNSVDAIVDNKDVISKTVEPASSKSEAESTTTQSLDIKAIDNAETSVSSNTFTTIGKPANILITKSYNSNGGMVITQSNMTTESQSELETVFDMVIVNDEKVNAGTLLRLVEPLPTLDLPAFTKELKKKIIPYHL